MKKNAPGNAAKPAILIVDDEPDLLGTMREFFDLMGFEASEAANGVEAIIQLQRASFDIVMTDLKMPKMDGMALLDRLREHWPDTAVIVMTSYGTIENAVEAMKRGASDYILKPIAFDQISLVVEKILERRKLLDENAYLREKVEEKYGFANIIGRTGRMLEIYEIVGAVAGTDSMVLIQGESGTGKELVANAIHFGSPRSTEKMITVNCSALTANLLESELFGHVRGAFTGAIKDKPGRFELADSGTLFLDEVGDMPLEIQPKLLRVLQEGEFERVGGTKTIQVDVRIIAATNRNLDQAVSEGTFRQDLFYRLNVIPIRMPLLRERMEDLPLLLEHFLEKLREKTGREVRKVSKRAFHAMMEYDWPGNVRELANAIEQGIIMAKNGTITWEDLPQAIRGDNETGALPDEGRSLPEIVETYEKGLILDALETCEGNISQAAGALNIHRTTLHSKLRKYGIA